MVWLPWITRLNEVLQYSQHYMASVERHRSFPEISFTEFPIQ